MDAERPVADLVVNPCPGQLLTQASLWLVTEDGATLVREGFENADQGSRCPPVLVDEPAQDVSASKDRAENFPMGRPSGGWRRQAKPSMRPLLHVVARVGTQDLFEMPPTEDQDVVQTLSPDRPHEPLCERVRSRCSDGRPDDLDAFGLEHGVEGS